MKVAVIWSSPNTDGLTATVKNNFIAGLEKTGAEVVEIHMNKLNMRYCQACGNGWGTCIRNGACVIQDDFARTYQQLVEADGIALISAVYWHDITECLKAFIDRLRRCEAHKNKYLAGKRCILIACAGGTGLGVVECLHKMEDTLKHMGMRAYDRIPITRYNKNYMLPAMEEAGETYGKRLAEGFDMGF